MFHENFGDGPMYPVNKSHYSEHLR